MRDPKIVSFTMSRIRGKDTSIELKLRRALWSAGHRYRLHVRGLPGTPDITFMKARLAVFCDSSFWHGRNWEAKKVRLANNRDYWIAKIERNMSRDARVSGELIKWGGRLSASGMRISIEMLRVAFRKIAAELRVRLVFSSDAAAAAAVASIAAVASAKLVSVSNILLNNVSQKSASS